MKHQTLNNGASQAQSAGGGGGFLPGFLNVVIGAGGVVLGAFAAAPGGGYSQVQQYQIAPLMQQGAPINYVKQESFNLNNILMPLLMIGSVLIFYIVLK